VEANNSSVNAYDVVMHSQVQSRLKLRLRSVEVFAHHRLTKQ